MVLNLLWLAPLVFAYFPRRFLWKLNPAGGKIVMTSAFSLPTFFFSLLLQLLAATLLFETNTPSRYTAAATVVSAHDLFLPSSQLLNFGQLILFFSLKSIATMKPTVELAVAAPVRGMVSIARLAGRTPSRIRHRTVHRHIHLHQHVHQQQPPHFLPEVILAANASPRTPTQANITSPTPANVTSPTPANITSPASLTSNATKFDDDDDYILVTDKEPNSPSTSSAVILRDFPAAASLSLASAARSTQGVSPQPKVPTLEERLLYPRPLLCFGSFGDKEGKFDHPSNLAVLSEGKIAVHDQNNQRVQILDTKGNYLAHFPASVVYIAHDSKRKEIIVLDYVQFRFFDDNGKFVRSLSAPNQGKSGLAADPQGNYLFVTNSRVHVVDNTGKEILSFGNKGNGEGEFSHPKAVGVLSTGEIVVADLSRVQIFTPGGKFLRVAKRHTDNNWAPQIFVDKDDNIYCTGFCIVEVFRADGTAVGRITTGRSNPAGISVDQDSKVFVSFPQEHQIRVY